ncbi:hypothetical protein HYPSUDRAFT_744643 [Hypholoma sublateritium FD-334 SS-4]|uniref:Uncharacterized protein n=1 Tax=Hypholoma sublateritium (strain FD-334 SS-4) TaxID=945553 RepID=A0A0D2LPQ4_HYPSF|nr:hypothetical protein HYPSUDRAFT_744643 [Hypholoma sublateritium FD-334 SS-4]
MPFPQASLLSKCLSNIKTPSSTTTRTVDDFFNEFLTSIFPVSLPELYNRQTELFGSPFWPSYVDMENCIKSGKVPGGTSTFFVTFVLQAMLRLEEATTQNPCHVMVSSLPLGPTLLS